MGTSRKRFLAATVVVVSVLVGCGQDEQVSLDLPTATSETTTSTTSVPSTTTTVPITTTTETPGPTYSERETAVREAHTHFMTVVLNLNELEEGIGHNRDLIEQYTIDPQKSRSLAGIEKRITASEHLVGPGYDSNIIQVQFKGDLAFVLDCSADQGQLVAADGEMPSPTTGIHKVRETHILEVDGKWMVKDFRVGGNTGCNPDGPPWDPYELP